MTFFLKKTETKTKQQKPTIGILRAKKAWKTSKHLFLYAFNSQRLRLVFHFRFFRWLRHSPMETHWLWVSEPRFSGREIEALTSHQQPAAQTHRQTAHEVTLCQSIQYQSNLVKTVCICEHNPELKTLPKVLIKHYSNRTRVCFHTVMCLPAYAFEVSFQALNSREENNCNPLLPLDFTFSTTILT